MGDVKLSSPRVTVIRDGHDPLEMQTTNGDLVLWDRTRARHKWPTATDAPVLWLTFVAWAAARRTGAITSETTYEKWEAETLDVGVVTDDDDQTADPTLPGVDPV